MHRPLKAALRTYCLKNQRGWADYVPSFIFSMNNMPSRIQGGGKMAPHLRVFGLIPRMPQELIFPAQGWDTEEDAFTKKVEVMEEARRLMRTWEEAEQVKAQRHTPKTIHVEFKVGDVVLLHVPMVPKGVSSKLQPSWQGPYFIKKQVGAYNYLIEGRGRTMIVHVRRLVKYDPYLYEHESLIEALERTKEAFNNPPPVRKTEEEDIPVLNDNGGVRRQEKRAQIEDLSRGKRRQKHPINLGESAKMASRRKRRAPEEERVSGGLGESATMASRPEASRTRKRGSKRVTIELPADKWKGHLEVRKVIFQVGKFYLVKPPLAYIADEDEHQWFVMRGERGTRTRRAKPVFHFWRSRDDENSRDKTFLPVYKDAGRLDPGYQRRRPRIHCMDH
jgi:hypothetical protein